MTTDLEIEVERSRHWYPAPLRKRQVEALARLRGRDFHALFWEMRTGKTAVILRHLDYLRGKGNVKKALVLAPPSAIPGWVENVADWAPGLAGTLFVGGRDMFDAWNAAEEGTMVLSYALTRSGAAPRGTRHVYARHVKNVDFVVCDESHRIKNHTAARTRFALSLGPRAKYRYILTGTPIGGTEMDLYYQMRFLSPAIWDHMGKEQFTRGYFTTRQTGYALQHTFDERCRRVLEEKLAEHSMALRLADTPGHGMEEEEVPVAIDMGREQEEALAALKRDFALQLEEGTVTAMSAGAAMAKANQIENGHVIDEDGVSRELPCNPKLDWLRANVRPMCKEHKVIIWTVFKKDRELVRRTLDELGVGYVDYKSGMSPGRRAEALRKFRDIPERRAIIAHPGSAGEGVDLHVAPMSIVYTRNHDWLAYAQAMARNRRPDTRRVVLYHPVVRGGVDERIFKRLKAKDRTAKGLMARAVMEEWAAS